MKIKELAKIDQVAHQYQLVLCDVWGVIHDGVQVFQKAVNALCSLRQEGKQVILVTNSPRLCVSVKQQLDSMGVSKQAYDYIVTSGDATLHLIKKLPQKLFYIGEKYGQSILQGTNAQLTTIDNAQAILCTGLFMHLPNELEQYENILRLAAKKDLPFICANPDKEVRVGDQIIYCAGALAKKYEDLGGKVYIAGKPHKIIYDLALDLAQKSFNKKIAKDKILAIGDGLLTDIKGANDYGIKSVLILDGVGAQKFIKNDKFWPELVESELNKYGLKTIGFMDCLK